MPSQADGTNGDGAVRGASLLPENYADDGVASAPASEAIVVVEPAVEPTPAPISGENGMPQNRLESRSKRPLPPVATRFKPGQSGNAGGRPKGIVSKALTKELKRKIAASGETMLQALVSGYVAKALEEQDPARFNSIRDTVDGRPASQDDGTGVGVGIVVQLEIVGK